MLALAYIARLPQAPFFAVAGATDADRAEDQADGLLRGAAAGPCNAREAQADVCAPCGGGPFGHLHGHLLADRAVAFHHFALHPQDIHFGQVGIAGKPMGEDGGNTRAMADRGAQQAAPCTIPNG